MRCGDDVIDDSDLEYVELETTEVGGEAYGAGRLLTVAMAGAFVSLGIYYLYQQLEPEKKSKLKKKATGFLQEQIHALTEVREDFP